MSKSHDIKPYYRFVGRRLYIVFGDNVVVSMEKLNISPSELGLRNPIEKDSDGNLVVHHDGRGMKLVDVFRRDNEGEKMSVEEFVTEDVGTPAHTRCGCKLEDYFCEKSSWVTQEEYDEYLRKLNSNIETEKGFSNE